MAEKMRVTHEQTNSWTLDILRPIEKYSPEVSARNPFKNIRAKEKLTQFQGSDT